MHLDFFAEGIDHDLDEFEKWLATRSFPMPVHTEDGKTHTQVVQGSLRPRRAYSYVFPRECLDVVLNTLDPQDCVHLTDGKGTPILRKIIKIMRRVLKLKPIPKPDPKKGTVPIFKQNVRIIGLGIREDIDKVTGPTHEAL